MSQRNLAPEMQMFYDENNCPAYAQTLYLII